MDSLISQLPRTTSLALYFYRRWPWLRWRTWIGQGIICSGMPRAVICIQFYDWRRSEPRSNYPSEAPSTSSDIHTLRGCDEKLDSILRALSLQGHGKTASPPTDTSTSS